MGASKTYTLPQAKEISPYRYVGVNFNSQGNPNLKPSDNYNFDLKWDFNPSPTELVSLTAFYKHIKDPISRIEVASAGGYLSYENISDRATVAGVEVEIRKNLFVCPLSSAANGMNKLSFGLNGSYIYTNAKMPLATVTTGSQLEGAAPWIANFDLSHHFTRDERSFVNTLVLNYVIDDKTISFTLQDKNVAFLDYMTIGILPKHLLEGKDMQADEYFHNPIGTGPYKIQEWDEGQSITLVKNEDYYKGAPKIDTIVFKIVPDDNAKALQLKSGEINLAKVTPKDAQNFVDDDAFTVYDMKTADYRGILYNFNNEFWQRNKDAIPGINYAIDRQKMVDSVLLGEGVIAYGPLQRNKYNNEDVEKYSYDPAKAKEVLEVAGWTLGEDGIYERNAEKLSFTINVMEGDQVRADLAAIACQQLKEVGVDAKAQVQSEIDWANQEAFLIGWGSPFDADDHTYKVFGTDKGSNYSGYSDEQVDAYLTQARQTSDENERKEAYAKFQAALAEDPAYTFFCYCDVDYVTNKKIQGITKDTVLGHHGVGIFWNVEDWTIE
mgnify:CR=1 FL=1